METIVLQIYRWDVYVFLIDELIYLTNVLAVKNVGASVIS